MAALPDQTDVMIGTVRVTVSVSAMLVGPSQGDNHIGLTVDEAQVFAALVTDKVGAYTDGPSPNVPKVSGRADHRHGGRLWRAARRPS
jgi:hypothetical protein